jgi:HAD superfamily hydrolase (TIGR01509 family)
MVEHDARPYGVLWDMDGVLVDSGDLHRRAWRIFLARQHKPVTDEAFERGFGQPNQAVLPIYFGEGLSAAEIAHLSDAKERCYRALVAEEGIAPTPGALDWLACFDEAGLRQALATSGCRANAELIVDRTSARRYFAAIVTADDVARGKPHPDLFMRAAAEIDVPPARCAVIEDSLHGIEAARRAGMPCLAIATTHSLDELAPADLALPDLRHLTWEAWRGLVEAGRQ